jgi:t-SNARE complex subunit (syntaxin)
MEMLLEEQMRTAREAYEHGFAAGLRAGALDRRERKAIRRAKNQSMVGWVLLAVALSICMAVLVTVPFPGLGTQ